MNFSKKKFLGLFFLLLAITLPACTGASTEGPTITDLKVTVSGERTATPTYVFQASKPGFATVSGQLLVLSPSVALPDPDDGIFLVPIDTSQTVSSIPQFEVGKVPQADVDEADGKFVFTDISPGTYAVMVLTVGQAQIPARYHGKQEMVIITIDQEDMDQTIDVGKVAIP